MKAYLIESAKQKKNSLTRRKNKTETKKRGLDHLFRAFEGSLRVPFGRDLARRRMTRRVSKLRSTISGTSGGTSQFLSGRTSGFDESLTTFCPFTMPLTCTPGGSVSLVSRFESSSNMGLTEKCGEAWCSLAIHARMGARWTDSASRDDNRASRGEGQLLTWRSRLDFNPFESFSFTLSKPELFFGPLPVLT